MEARRVPQADGAVRGLIQRPPQQQGGSDDQMGLPIDVQSTTMAKPGAVSTGTLALLFQFDTLVVATLLRCRGPDALIVGPSADCELRSKTRR